MDFRADIQGVRALAVILVMLCHFNIPGFSGGFIGVDIFFVVSGYLITGVIFNSYKSIGAFSFLEFYARRFLRLLPALIVMLLLVSMAASLLISPSEQVFHAQAIASASLWLSNFYYAAAQLNYFDPSTRGALVLHTWSLGVEEQFYLIWPLLVVVALKAKRKRDNEIPSLISIFFLLSLLACVILTYVKPTWAYYIMPTRLWQFSIGGILYLVCLNNQPYQNINPVLIRFVGCGGLFLIIISLILLPTQKYYPGYIALLPTVAAAILLFRVPETNQYITERVFTFPIMQYLGNISYSLYLWHWPIFQFINSWLPVGPIAKAVAAIFISIMVSTASYYCIERPFRHSIVLKKRSVLVIFASLVLCCGAFWVAVYWSQKASEWSGDASLAPYKNARVDILFNQGCDQWYMSSEVNPCVYGNEGGLRTVVLIGDSIASQWFPAVLDIYKEPEWKVVALIKSACPAVDEKYYYPRLGRDYFECYAWRDNAFKYIAELKPDVVIMSSGLMSFTQDQWIKGTARILDRIENDVGGIYIIAPTPHLAFDSIECLSRQAWANKFFPLNALCYSENNNPQVKEITSYLQQSVTLQKNVKLIDMSDVICPDGICYAEKNGLIVFRDTQHLHYDFVESISADLKEKIDNR